MGYTLSSIVHEYLIEIGAGQSNMYARYYQFGVNFLRSKHFDTTGFPTVVELTISDNDTVNLPIDYVQYTRIALCVDGKLYSLGVNNSICLDKCYDDCGNPTSCFPTTETASTVYGTTQQFIGPAGPTMIADNYRNGELMGRFFGAGSSGNSLGEYRIDKTTGQIKFSGLVRSSTVVLEYLADIDVISGDFQVHAFCLEALKDSMAWQYKVRSNKPLGEQQMAHEIFKISNRNMKHRFLSASIEDWGSSMLTGQSQTPKLG